MRPGHGGTIPQAPDITACAELAVPHDKTDGRARRHKSEYSALGVLAETKVDG
jgi:hypothetical protein